MILKTKYFFKTGEKVSEYRDTLEEAKHDVIMYKQETKEEDAEFFIFRNEKALICDKNGNLIYQSEVITREFHAEMELFYV